MEDLYVAGVQIGNGKTKDYLTVLGTFYLLPHLTLKNCNCHIELIIKKMKLDGFVKINEPPSNCFNFFPKWLVKRKIKMTWAFLHDLGAKTWQSSQEQDLGCVLNKHEA